MDLDKKSFKSNCPKSLLKALVLIFALSPDIFRIKILFKEEEEELQLL